MMQASIALISKTKIKMTDDYKDIENSDIVVITAGMPRKEGMSREDLLEINIKIMKEVVLNIKKFAPNSIIIVVSNPLDIMTYAALRLSGFDKSKVIGMGGILDSARMAHSIIKKIENKKEIVKAMVIGSHSEHMVPLFSNSFMGDKPLKEIFDKQTQTEIAEQTKSGGARIVNFLQTSAYYAPAASICILIEAILNDKKSVLPCSALLEGEYETDGVCIGVPSLIGKNGLEKIVILPLDEEEKLGFKKSASFLNESLNLAKKYIETTNL
jgi:malate dehydrogenase